MSRKLWTKNSTRKRHSACIQSIKRWIKMNALTLLAIEKLMKEKGAQRVSESAKIELQKILENYLYELSIKASKIASHSKRKTINSGDLLIAKE
ncbi:MAG: histone [Nanoarchaeota archaeon]